MKAMSLAFVLCFVSMGMTPVFAAEDAQAKDGHLSYSGTFLTWRDADHHLKLTTDGRQRIFVSSIWPGGWMGLQSSDQIERIDGQPLRWVGQLVDQLKARSGAPVVLTVYHHDIDLRVYEKREIRLTAAEYAKLIPDS